MELRPVAVGILNASIAGCVCSFVLLILKFVARYRSKSPFGFDDVLVATSWMITIPLSVAFYERELIQIKGTCKTQILTFVFETEGRHGLGYTQDELPDYGTYLTQRKW